MSDTISVELEIINERGLHARAAASFVKTIDGLNADVQVSQEEYDEVVAIKPMFLNADYQ